jgi:hypothetical protein
MTNAAERSIRRSDLENWSHQILSLARTSAPRARAAPKPAPVYTKTLSKDKCVRSKSITRTSLSAACWGREPREREEDARKMFVFGSQGANYSFPISITAPPNTQAKSNFPPPGGQLHREGRHAWFSTQNRSNSPRLPRRLRRRKSKRAAACAREFTTEKSIQLSSLCLPLRWSSRIERCSCYFSLSRQRHAASRRRRRATLICRAREINFPCRLNESKTAWPMACLHSPARGQLINYTHFSPVQAPHDPKCHSPFTTLSRQKRQRAA